MKVRNLPHPLGPRRQEGRPEMEGAFLLAEAAARDDADARGVEEAEAVEFVRGAVFGFGGVDGFLRKGDGGEEVHGALWWNIMSDVRELDQTNAIIPEDSDTRRLPFAGTARTARWLGRGDPGRWRRIRPCTAGSWGRLLGAG